MRGMMVAAALLGSSSPALADMSGLVGDTVIAESPDGVVRRIELRADGAYRRPQARRPLAGALAGGPDPEDVGDAGPAADSLIAPRFRDMVPATI